VDCKARSILFEAGLDPEFWCFAVEHTVYIKNRVPTVVLPYEGLEVQDVITPFEAYSVRVPNLEKLVVFECKASPLATPEKHPRKMQSRVKLDYIFIGIEGSKVFKLMNLHSKLIESYGDAKFDEYRFPWLQYNQACKARHRFNLPRRYKRL
jgi:hypothetical protein